MYKWLKFWFWNKKGSSKKFYERHVYESVDDRILGYVIPQK